MFIRLPRDESLGIINNGGQICKAMWSCASTQHQSLARGTNNHIFTENGNKYCCISAQPGRAERGVQSGLYRLKYRFPSKEWDSIHRVLKRAEYAFDRYMDTEIIWHISCARSWVKIKTMEPSPSLTHKKSARYYNGSICTIVTTREDPFSKLLVQFPDSHHKATPTNQKCTLNSLIKHHFEPEDLLNYECLTCSRRTLATQRIQRSCYPGILCIVQGCKMNDETRITLAVNYPVIDLNPCTFFGSHEEMVDLKYNLIATVNHKPSKKNDGHYTAVNKSPTSRS